jgi:apolipoprotein N-acyltransferase
MDKWYQKAWFLDLLALCSGMLLPLAFAPTNLYLLAFISPALWLATLLNIKSGRAFWRGWLYGFGMMLIGASWIFVSIHFYGNTPAWLAALGTLGFVALLGVFFALQAFCLVRFFPTTHWLKLTLAFACIWVFQEWLRSFILTGFPWLLLGNSQVDTWLGMYAPLGSVYAVSFIVAICAGLLVNLWYGHRHYLISVIVIGLLFLGGGLLSLVSWTHPVSIPVNVSLVQGDIPQSVKWNADALNLSLSRYRGFTEMEWRSSIIAWPESAIPALLNDVSQYVDRIAVEAKKHNSTVIIGAPSTDITQHFFYNSVVAVGNGSGTYLKRHLVPFGEYVPLEYWLRGLIGFFNLPMSGFSNGLRQQPLIRAGQIPIATYLCYEIAYVNLLWPDLPQAQLLLNMSDDTWFGKSWAAVQQLQIAQMRSLETGRYQMVVANDGLTAIVDQHGNVTASIPRFTSTVLTGTVIPMSGSTPLIATGLLFWELVLIAVTLATWLLLRLQLKKTPPPMPAKTLLLWEVALAAATLGIWLWMRNRQKK